MEAELETRDVLNSMLDGLEGFKLANNSRVSRIEAVVDRMETKMARPGFGGGSNNFASGGIGSLGEQKASADLNAYVRGQFKALQDSIDPNGGYLVPDTLQQTETRSLLNTPALLTLCRTQVWDGPGGSWIEPKFRATLTARRRGGELEAAQDTATANPIGLLDIPVGEAEASIVLSQMLLDDANRDLTTLVVTDMRQAFDRQLDGEIVNGTSVGGQAQGFLTVPTSTAIDSARGWGTIQYVPTGSAGSITGDSLFDLIYSLRAVYRGDAQLVMSSATAALISKLKSGDGTYLWRDAVSQGQPPTLLGFPVICDENMPSVTAGSLPIAFASWNLAYVIAKKGQMRLLRDPFTAKPNTVLYGYARQGGAVANSEAIKLLKVSET